MPSSGHVVRVALAGMCVTAALACRRTEQVVSGSHLLLMNTEQRGAQLLVTVRGDSGAQLNARLAPTLEFDDGSIARLTGGDITADSAYFDSPVSVLLDSAQSGQRGRLRAGVCRRGATYCETVTVAFAPHLRARRPG